MILEALFNHNFQLPGLNYANMVILLPYDVRIPQTPFTVDHKVLCGDY